MRPPAIAVEGLSVSVGNFHLNQLSFSLTGGKILVILGPNGSGKSVTLETIAGFHRPAAGCVLISGRDVTQLAPEQRNVALVVQNFGLFPHLTVAQNVAIALRGGRSGAAASTSLPHGDAGKLLAYFGIARLAERKPQSLSPGEKQRVALARALAAEPELFLFDEPFSALDAATRDQLREELLAFLRKLSLPAIFVTHDHSDALTLADKIIVLRDGAIMQSGTADEIFYRPADVFVARFVGVENILAGSIADTGGKLATVIVGGQTLRAAAPTAALGPDVTVSIRAECITLHPPRGERRQLPDVNRLDARVTGLRVLGALATVEVDCGFPLKAYVLAQQAQDLVPGRAVELDIPAATIHLMAN